MTKSADSNPRVGVGVFVFDEPGGSQYLIGKRLGSHGAGTFALPGGHLEFGESFEECAAREVLEETGLAIEQVSFLTATNSVFEDSGKHYVTIFMTAVALPAADGGVVEPQLLEPDKCEGWIWTSFSSMQDITTADSVLFLPLVNLIDQRPQVCERLKKSMSAM